MTRLRGIGRWLHRRADDIGAIMLAVMFTAFILQVVFRYLLNWPTGWTTELSIVMWLWLVLWGAAFMVPERDEIRFDILYSSVRPQVRRVMVIVTAVALLGLYGVSLPATWDFVSFMRVTETSYLDIRNDRLFAIYLVFVVAMLLRYTWLLVAALRGKVADAAYGEVHE